jgi:hypothetical protein
VHLGDSRGLDQGEPFGQSLRTLLPQAVRAINATGIRPSPLGQGHGQPVLPVLSAVPARTTTAVCAPTTRGDARSVLSR